MVAILICRSEDMDSQEFVNKCKELISEYVNQNLDATEGKQITTEDVFVVWLSKALQNNKAMLSTTLPDGMYYEVTHNGDKKEIYLDAYKKWENIPIRL